MRYEADDGTVDDIPAKNVFLGVEGIGSQAEHAYIITRSLSTVKFDADVILWDDACREMNARTKQRLTAAGVVNPAPPGSVEGKPLSQPVHNSIPKQSPLLISDPFTRQCIQDFNEGRVYTLKEISIKTKLSYGKVRLVFMDEPGVTKWGAEYRVPYCVFDRTTRRMMQFS